MDKLKLELDVLLPQNGDCERCVDRLQTSLQPAAWRRRGPRRPRRRRRRGCACTTTPTSSPWPRSSARRARPARSVQQRYQHRELDVEGMDCADCATKLEQGVGRLDGVLFCSVNFAARQDAGRIRCGAAGPRGRAQARAEDGLRCARRRRPTRRGQAPRPLQRLGPGRPACSAASAAARATS